MMTTLARTPPRGQRVQRKSKRTLVELDSATLRRHLSEAKKDEEECRMEAD